MNQISALSKRVEYDAFLLTEYSKPFSAAGFTNWFRERVKDVGLPAHCVAHGLRKAAARRLAEVGCSSKEIASITGHESLKEVERYVAEANQKILAVQAMAREHK